MVMTGQTEHEEQGAKRRYAAARTMLAAAEPTDLLKRAKS